jgi:hypothetical protein
VTIDRFWTVITLKSAFRVILAPNFSSIWNLDSAVWMTNRFAQQAFHHTDEIFYIQFIDGFVEYSLSIYVNLEVV